jgi:dsRNA-specific ribonuclease
VVALNKVRALLTRAGLLRQGSPSKNRTEVADTFKALVGAVLLDQGPTAAAAFARKVVSPRLDSINVEDLLSLRHPKVTLAKFLARDKQPAPKYRSVTEHPATPGGRAGGWSPCRFLRCSPPPLFSTPLVLSRVLNETGRLTHLPTFQVAVFSGDKELATAASYSLKIAEAEAARNALRSHFAVEINDVAAPADP